MSRIVSPLPPIRISITLDERTGLASMQISKDMEFDKVADVFASLMIQVIENRLKVKPVTFDASQQLPFEIAMLSLAKLMRGVIDGKRMSEQIAKNPDNPFENPFGKPEEKPNENPAGNSAKVQ